MPCGIRITLCEQGRDIDRPHRMRGRALGRRDEAQCHGDREGGECDQRYRDAEGGGVGHGDETERRRDEAEHLPEPFVHARLPHRESSTVARA